MSWSLRERAINPEHAKEILTTVLPENPDRPCEITLWNGEKLEFGKGGPKLSIVIKDPKVFEELLVEPSLAFGEGYINGDLEINGNLGDVMEWFYKNAAEERLSPFQKARVCWIQLKRRATISQTKKDVQSHYDKGNDFYKLWLDKGMNYSCAFFRSEDEDLEQAQLNKIHRSLKKLRLKPGQRLLDIGCGWGSLIMEAAKRYGVRAVGLTLSENQFELGNKRIKDAGLEDQAEIRLQDYREMSEKEFKSFDRIISIGMFEHVGKENIPVFFDHCSRLLKDDGIMLLHTIGRTKPKEMDVWILKYIFPGTYLPSLGELVETAEDKGFDFVDLENLRRHYDLTLGNWAKRFEEHVDTIRSLYDEKFVRMWRFYLYGCQMAFRYNPLFVFQLLFTLGRRNDMPLVREELYT